MTDAINQISMMDHIKLNTINDVFMQKKEYFILALTGKVGSGCSDTANRIMRNIDDLLPSPPQPGMDGLNSDLEREIRIVRRFYSDNAPQEFRLIRTREIITSFLLESNQTWARIADFYTKNISNGENISLWNLCMPIPQTIENGSRINIDNVNIAIDYVRNITQEHHPESMTPETFEIYKYFISEWLPTFSKNIHDSLGKHFTNLFQQYGNEIRFFGTLDTSRHEAQWNTWYSTRIDRQPLKYPDAHPIYSIAARINSFIKILRRDNYEKKIVKKPIPIIIDSIKNVYESNYLKDRYSAYYLISISCSEDIRQRRLMHNPIKRYTSEMINRIDFNERPGHSSKKLRPFLDVLQKHCEKCQSRIGKDDDRYSLIDKMLKYISLINSTVSNISNYNSQIHSDQFILDEKQYQLVKSLIVSSHEPDNDTIFKAFKKESITTDLQEYYWHIFTDPLRIFLYLTGLFPFFLQDVESCIQNADIFIADTEDEQYKPRLNYQLIRYISLIIHPGLLLPTSVERCMQIAYAAKANSGCISRQVGAVTTDSDYNILSLGWNDVPCGETSCVYRNLIDLSKNIDKPAYSDYEYDGDDAFQELLRKYKFIPGEIKLRLNGLPACFCFKDLHAEITGEKNPMNARAMHAEEKAMLTCDQQRIVDGCLFTTSSPCEMCAKNSKQHHIKKIYYVEPYPGISQKHCCRSGIEENRAEYILFEGAIGRAYTQLYTPIIPYKDELNLRGFPKSFKAKE